MTKKYRKKPVVIEAVKWTGDNDQKVAQIDEGIGALNLPLGLDRPLTIFTLEGEMRVDEGDYIIKGVRTELYPCKPDIFEETYEEVSE